MLQWRPLLYGSSFSLSLAAIGWLTLGFVAAAPVFLVGPLVGGLITGYLIEVVGPERWRTGGYHGMLAGGLGGIGLVATVAAISLTSGSPVVGTGNGVLATLAALVGSPFGIPFGVIGGTAGGVAGGALRTALSGRSG